MEKWGVFWGEPGKPNAKAVPSKGQLKETRGQPKVWNG